MWCLVGFFVGGKKGRIWAEVEDNGIARWRAYFFFFFAPQSAILEFGVDCPEQAAGGKREKNRENRTET